MFSTLVIWRKEDFTTWRLARQIRQYTTITTFNNYTVCMYTAKINIQMLLRLNKTTKRAGIIGFCPKWRTPK